MSQIALTADTAAAQAIVARIADGAPTVVVRALNRGIGSAKTLMVRAIAQDLGLKAGDVREKLYVREARPDQLEARLMASRKRIPIIDFAARGPIPSRGKGRGVTARTKTRRYPHAFIATMGSGHTGVFQRVGLERLPIRELFGASLGRVFAKFMPAARARAEEQFVKNLQSELRFLVRSRAA